MLKDPVLEHVDSSTLRVIVKDLKDRVWLKCRTLKDRDAVLRVVGWLSGELNARRAKPL